MEYKLWLENSLTTSWLEFRDSRLHVSNLSPSAPVICRSPRGEPLDETDLKPVKNEDQKISRNVKP